MTSLLILCSDADATALHLAHQLPHRTGGRVDIITTSQLATALEWRIHLDQQTTSWQIHLTDGRQFRSETVGAIYCRLDYTQAPYFADQTDAGYASLEFQAMVSGWLRSAGVPLVNPVAPVMLSAVPMNPWLRRLILAKSGLPVAQTASLTAPQRWSGLSRLQTDAGPQTKPIRTGAWLQEPLSDAKTSIVAAGDTLVGPLADRYSQEVRRLQEHLKAAVIQVTFATDQQGNYRAVDFQTIPTLSTAEEFALLTNFLADFMEHINLIAA